MNYYDYINLLNESGVSYYTLKNSKHLVIVVKEDEPWSIKFDKKSLNEIK